MRTIRYLFSFLLFWRGVAISKARNIVRLNLTNCREQFQVNLICPKSSKVNLETLKKWEWPLSQHDGYLNAVS